MGKKIVIDENDLKGLIKEAVEDAVDNVTRKISAKLASRYYNNTLFETKRVCYNRTSWGGGCGSDYTSGGGCGNDRPIVGGCGSSYSSGGC